MVLVYMSPNMFFFPKFNNTKDIISRHIAYWGQWEWSHVSINKNHHGYATCLALLMLTSSGHIVTLWNIVRFFFQSSHITLSTVCSHTVWEMDNGQCPSYRRYVHCMAVYCIVLIVLCCSVLHCILLYCVIICCILLHFSLLYCTLL